jgi:hypothetical protein
MDSKKIIGQIMKKKEFSKLPLIDVKLALKQFEDDRYINKDRVKLTRGLLKKVFSVFSSGKIGAGKDRSVDWLLKKHLSTRERLKYYEGLYSRLFKNYLGKKVSVFDLGAGVNGLSYNYFKDISVDYVGVESLGQLVEVMNDYFKKEKLKGVAVHTSLFDLNGLKKIIKKKKGKKIIFLFKVIDSLEMMKRNYSKKLLLELVPLVDEVVVSFSTENLLSKKKFYATRKWLIEFINKNFNISDSFMFGSEKYIVFRYKKI